VAHIAVMPSDNSPHARPQAHYLALAATHRERAVRALDRDSAESHMKLADDCKAMAREAGAAEGAGLR
jgi:hypothetical protein